MKNEIPQNLLPYLNQLIPFAREMVSKGEEIPPLCLIGKDGDEGFGVILDMSRDETKMASVATVRTLCEEREFDWAIFISESWAVKPAPGTSYDFKTRVSEHQDRIECVMIVVENRDHAWNGFAEVTSLGNSRGISKVEWAEADCYTGNLSNLLGRRTRRKLLSFEEFLAEQKSKGNIE